MQSSVIVYRGPSRLDGRPIVAVLAGLGAASSNAKTGAMAQLYILVDGMSAHAAWKAGADASICGDCPHRGVPGVKPRTCYVSFATGLLSISRSLEAGTYAQVSTRQACELVRGRALRLGAYGDPAALPHTLLRALARACTRHTGYTHQWRRFPALRGLLMASVDSEAEHTQAHTLGWRTFRIRAELETPRLTGEVVCPASEEAGKRTQCASCGLCDGARAADKRASISIVDHSGGALTRRRYALKVLSHTEHAHV